MHIRTIFHNSHGSLKKLCCGSFFQTIIHTLSLCGKKFQTDQVKLEIILPTEKFVLKLKHSFLNVLLKVIFGAKIQI